MTACAGEGDILGMVLKENKLQKVYRLMNAQNVFLPLTLTFSWKESYWGPVLWPNSLSYCLRCWHLMWLAICVPAAPLVMPFPGNDIGKAAKKDPCHTCEKPAESLRLLASAWCSPGRCNIQGMNQQLEDFSLSLFFFLSLPSFFLPPCLLFLPSLSLFPSPTIPHTLTSFHTSFLFFCSLPRGRMEMRKGSSGWEGQR